MSAALIIESVCEARVDPRIHDAVLGWLDQKGSKSPTQKDAIDYMRRAGVPNPEKAVDAFMIDLDQTSVDADFTDEYVAEARELNVGDTFTAKKSWGSIIAGETYKVLAKRMGKFKGKPELQYDVRTTSGDLWTGTLAHDNVVKALGEDAPPGWEPTVKAMKKHKDIDNPWALAWWMKGKGMKSRK